MLRIVHIGCMHAAGKAAARRRQAAAAAAIDRRKAAARLGLELGAGGDESPGQQLAEPQRAAEEAEVAQHQPGTPAGTPAEAQRAAEEAEAAATAAAAEAAWQVITVHAANMEDPQT